MMSDRLNIPGTTIVERAKLSNYTTFRLGGVCPKLIDCTNARAFVAVWTELIKNGVQPILIGGGSNLLISDEGIQQTVVRYCDEKPDISREDDEIVVSAGTLLDDLARVTAEWSLDGLVMCSGIPGTVGGAIAGNAGAFGQQIGDGIISVDVIDQSGNIQTRLPTELGFSYRRSMIPQRGDVLVSARISLEQGIAADLLKRRQEILDLRASKHPDWHSVPTAGSFFKNIEPTSKAERRQAAGWYLEQAGALNMRVGGARTFPRHANIVIAEPGCRASDVKQLSDMMADAVKSTFGLVLEREVKMMGSFNL
jgi:UDP-N-acetylmuramate dehydrogenase